MDMRVSPPETLRNLRGAFAMMRVCAGVLLGVLVNSCLAAAEAPETDHFKPEAESGKTRDERIKALIEQLAISDKVAGEEPTYTESKDTPATDKRAIARKAAEKLTKLGVEAIPHLLKSMDDKRESIPAGAILPCSVGVKCIALIQEIIVDIPEDYYVFRRKSLFWGRTGVDKKNHSPPEFIDWKNIDKWWPRGQAGRNWN